MKIYLEDKEAIFDAADTVKSCLAVFDGMFKSIKFKTENMHGSASGGYTNATDAADWLVKKGVAFRDAHEIIGKLVRYAIEKKLPLSGLSLDEFKNISDVFDETVYRAISVENCVDARNVDGGPAESSAIKAIGQAEAFCLSAKTAGQFTNKLSPST